MLAARAVADGAGRAGRPARRAVAAAEELIDGPGRGAAPGASRCRRSGPAAPCAPTGSSSARAPSRPTAAARCATATPRRSRPAPAERRRGRSASPPTAPSRRTTAPAAQAATATRLVRRFGTALRREGVADTAEGRQALDRARGRASPTTTSGWSAARTRPVAVERDFTLTVGPHRVHGRIDRIDAHPAGGLPAHRLQDRQAADGGRARRARPVLRLYMPARARRGASSRAGRPSSTSSTATPAACTPTRDDDAAVVEAVRDAADGIAAGRFEPRPSWDCRTCDFALICPAQDR